MLCTFGDEYFEPFDNAIVARSAVCEMEGWKTPRIIGKNVHFEKNDLFDRILLDNYKHPRQTRFVFMIKIIITNPIEKYSWITVGERSCRFVKDNITH